MVLNITVYFRWAKYVGNHVMLDSNSVLTYSNYSFSLHPLYFSSTDMPSGIDFSLSGIETNISDFIFIFYSPYLTIAELAQNSYFLIL